MGSLVLDVSKVNSYVLPNLVKSKNLLQNAYSTSNTLKNSLPSSFKYRSYVSDIVNQIYNIRREIVDIESMISKKIEQVKNIEKTRENRASSISRMASQIGGFVGTVGGAVIGSASGGIVGATAKAVVGNKVGKTIVDTGAKVAKSVISGVKSLGTSIIDGFKWIGTKVVSGVTSAVNWVKEKATSTADWVADKFNKAIDWGKKAMDATGAFFSKAGSTIWNGLKSAWNWVANGENWKKLGASIANGIISFVKGLVGLIETIGDLVLILSSTAGTIFSGLSDIVSGITTGNWDWKSTKDLWDTTKTLVAYKWTNKAFDTFYETKAGKWLDEYAYEPFKSDGIGCRILEGIGYVTGVVSISIATFGAADVAFGATATVGGISINAGAVGLTATATGLAKHTSEEWNKNNISLKYNGNDIEIPLDYETYSEIEKLKKGETKTITQQIQLEDGSIQELVFKITGKGNGQYDIIDNAGNSAILNGLNESSTAMGLLKGAGGGIADGFKYYTAVSTLGNIQSFGGMIKGLGSGNYAKGAVSLVKNFGFKQSFKPLVKKAAVGTFKDIGFYIDSGTFVANEVKSGVQTGEWDLKNISAGIFNAYASNFLGNLGGEYLGGGLDSITGDLVNARIDSDDVLSSNNSINNIEKANNVFSFDESDLKYEHSSIVKNASNRLVSSANRYRYTDTNLVEGLNDSIKENGLYHFSSDVDKILDSGFVKSSGHLRSYGEKKSFFFNGVPEVGAYASNLDDIPLKTEAIKIFPSDEILNSSKLKVRNYDDFAVTYSGNLKFDSQDASKQYFVLRKVDDKLVYANVNKAFYDNYQNTAEGLAVSEFIKNKKNKNLIKEDYYTNLTMKSTGADISSSKVANKFSNEIPKVNSSKINKDWDLEVARVNNSINKGYYTVIDVDSIDDIPKDFLQKITDVDQISFRVAGENVDWKRVYAEQNLSKFKNISSEINEVNVTGVNDFNKQHSDQLYRQNLEKYKNISGYDDYYAVQELKRTKSNLDRASELLDEWGKKNGYDNYAEKALRRYAETGSAYQLVDGVRKPYITSSSGVRAYIETLTPTDVSRYLYNKQHYSTLRSSSVQELNNFFKGSSSKYSCNYGVDQGGIKNLCEYTLDGKKYTYKQARALVNEYKKNGWDIPEFKKKGTLEYFDLKDKLVTRGFTKEQASVILSSIDDIGGCSYAAKANSIFYKFSKNPDLFEECFGFPMYKITSNGEKILNSNELLLDMYLHVNDISNGGKLFVKAPNSDSYLFNTDGRIDVFGRPMLDTKHQICVSTSKGSNNAALKSYLGSKGLEWDSDVLVINRPNNVLSNKDFNSYVNNVNSFIEDGYAVQLNLFSNGNEVRMINSYGHVEYTTKNWKEGMGHAVFVTGMTNEGFLVSSWGKEYLIPFQDLQNGGYFNIMIDDINIIK